MITKEQVLEMIKNLPDDVSYDDIEYHIYVQKRVVRARQQADRGETISHEEAIERLKKWQIKQASICSRM